MLKMLELWVRWVARHGRTVLLGLAALTLAASWLAVERFRIDSDLSKLIDQRSAWRQNYDRFEQRFPNLVRTAIVVVSGTSERHVRTTAQRLLGAIEARPDVFASVSASRLDPFFRDHALLYFDQPQFDALVDRLSEAQPVLSAISAKPSALTLLEQWEQARDNGADASMLRDRLASAARRALDGRDEAIEWMAPSAGVSYQLIFLQGVSAHDEALPDAEVMRSLRALVAEVPGDGDVQVRLSGEIALQHEEIEAALDGIQVAGWLALALLLGVMIFGVRSLKIILATFLMLAGGVAWTAAFAMLTVGAFNTLSVVFVVLFFGLGVDFALHFCLRFQEAINQGGVQIERALVTSARSVGRAITLCSLTTAIAFLGFVPTAYAGLGDLGIISAGGMAIAWLFTFTFLPAFFSVFGAPRAHRMDLPSSEGAVAGLVRHRQWVLAAVLLVAVLAGAVASGAGFDYSVLALKDPRSPSMVALRELQTENIATDYQIVIVSDRPLDTEALTALPSVAEVLGPERLLPDNQEARLEVIQDLSFLFWDVLDRPSEAEDVPAASLRQALQRLLSTVPAGTDTEAEQMKILAELATAETEVLQRWQRVLLANLLADLKWLKEALSVDAVTMDDVPAAAVERFLAADGSRLYAVLPRENVAPVEALERFIRDVQSLYPEATGRPVLERGVGDIVLASFQQAMLFAFAGVVLVVGLALRRVRATALVLLPLVLAGICTLAAGVLLDQPINMASVLVLPLIFGLGVDNGIHVVDRYLGEGDVDHLMHSSTPRAVLLSSLTTIGAFSALSISPHWGTASIGILLAISVGLILVLTLFLLPVLLSFLQGREAAKM